MQLIIENVRSFFGRHCLPIRPLTILLGENSTGKSTFLAMLAAVSDPSGFPAHPPFNEPPYDLGSYDTIATYKGGKYGRARSFSIGLSQEEGAEGQSVEMVATYTSRLGQAELSTYGIRGTKGELSLAFRGAKVSGDLHLNRDGEHAPFDMRIEERSLPAGLRISGVGLQVLPALIYEASRNQARTEPILHRLIAFLEPFLAREENVLSIAPIRTKPKRTYDEISDTFKPEGDHIPLLLARVLSEDPGSTIRQNLTNSLVHFGKSSALFNDVKVKKLGNKPSDPFQILVAVQGRPNNLPDVGYGVSQALPIVVQCVLAAPRRRLLLQQPEVHLHPRAQAALGSFFVRIVSDEKKPCVIETHSDYLVDRIRQEVAQQAINADSVSILFFEKRKSGTRVSPLTLDRAGNIIGAPRSYRQFFLEEETNLLFRKTT